MNSVGGEGMDSGMYTTQLRCLPCLRVALHCIALKFLLRIKSYVLYNNLPHSFEASVSSVANSSTLTADIDA